MQHLIVAMCRDEAGAAAIEYVLIAALVSVAAIVGMSAAGGSLSDMLVLVSSVIADSVAQGAST